jgi:hypothetical protein
MSSVNSIADAITALTKLLGKWLDGATGRRSRRAIEAAEKYIFTNEDRSLKDYKRKKLLRKYKKVFFTNN